MTSELAIHPSLLMSMTVSTFVSRSSMVSKCSGSVRRAARTFSLTFHTPTGITYPGWASLMITAPAVRPSLMRSSLIAILDA